MADGIASTFFVENLVRRRGLSAEALAKVRAAEERIAAFVGNEERLDARAQRGVAMAGTVEKRGPLRRRPGKRFSKEFFVFVTGSAHGRRTKG